MYVKNIWIKNIRSIAALDWECPPRQLDGWHVVIGDNGSGKSSFLRSVALALIGPTEAAALRQDWNNWLRSNESHGSIHLAIKYEKDWDKLSGSGPIAQGFYPPVRINFTRQENNEVKLNRATIKKFNPDRYVWGGKSGWFSASYGPYRRFSGGDKEYEKIYYSNPRLAPHLSVFGESIALTECIRWLQELQFMKLEKRPEGKLLDHIKAFVNQDGFLPHHAQLQEVSSKGVEFVDGNGFYIPVEDLSDGYRSVLSMTFELIRQLARVYGPDRIFDKKDPTKIIAPGVVLIDEIDAHLHPTWQRTIGVWFRQHFPKLQFIVTTHSPLVCQAADIGTVYRLPSPGSDEVGAMVTGVELDRLLYGNVLDAYSTELFGEDISRSEKSRQRLQRLAELNSKELHGKLTAAEQREQVGLRATLPTSAHTLGNGTVGGKK